MNNTKYHYVSDKLADLVLQNSSCSSLTPLLDQEGVFEFRKQSGKDLYGTLFGHPIRLAHRKGYQSASEGNNDIGVLALRELLVNADEALVELDYALHDTQDYKNVISGEKSKYEISSIIDAVNTFPACEKLLQSQKRINAVFSKGSKSNLRSLFLQDSGIGQCGDSFDGNFTYSNRHTTKSSIPFLNGFYGMGSTQVTRFQDYSTLRYRFAFSRRHPKFVDQFDFDEGFGKNIHFAMNLILDLDVFDDKGILSHKNCPFVDRGYQFYSLEIQLEDGTYKHPICSEDYKFMPSYANQKAKENCQGLTHGTLVIVPDLDLHKNANQVCPVYTDKKFYDSGSGINALASALNSTHPEYGNIIGIDDITHKEQRKKSSSDSGGGSSRQVKGLNWCVAKDQGYELIEVGEFNQVLFGKEETINVRAYYDDRNVKPQYKSVTAMNGCSYMLGNSFATHDSLTRIRTRYNLPKELADLLKIVIDLNNCSEKCRRKMPSSSRNDLNIDKAIRDEIIDRAKDQILANSRIQELCKKHASTKTENVESFKEEDFNLINPLFVNVCKKEISTPKPHPNPTFDKVLKNIDVNPNTLKRKVINESKVTCKCIDSNSSSFNLKFVHNVLGSVVNRYRFDVKVETSTDEGKTWSGSMSNTPIFDKDGSLEIRGIKSPNITELKCEDKIFFVKVSLEPRNPNQWVDPQFTGYSEIINILFEEERNITHTSNTRKATAFTYARSNGVASNACPLELRIIKDASQFIDDDESYKYWVDTSDDNNIRYMKEDDAVGFSNELDKQVIYLNATHKKLISEMKNLSEVDKDCLLNTLAGQIKNRCSYFMSNGNKIQDLSFINDSISADILYAVVLLDKSIKQSAKEIREKREQAEKRSKNLKPSSRTKNTAKKKGSAKKKSTQKV